VPWAILVRRPPTPARMRSKLILFAVISVVALLGLAFVCGIFMPGKWHVEAKATIQAPSSAIFPLLDDVGRWPEWFPWNTQKDPAITYAYPGKRSGVGAVLEWDSQKVGHGTMTLTESDPEKGIAYDLVLRGSDQPTHGAISLVKEGDATGITWTDGGELGANPIARLFRAMIEQMLTKDFLESLARLERVATTPASAAPPSAPVQETAPKSR
jgi:hypothetical protein